MSLQDYIRNRRSIGNRHASDPVEVGDIYYADLGLNYANEVAYSHPVIVLEKLGDMFFVVPTTTSDRFITEAYHPIDNPAGNRSFRKVKQREDGLLETSAIILNNARSIYNYRLVNKVGRMQDIYNEESIFYEIKKDIFRFHHPEMMDYLLKLEREQEAHVRKIEELESEVFRLSKELKAKEVLDNLG